MCHVMVGDDYNLYFRLKDHTVVFTRGVTYLL
jgi:hypothetical protein